MRTTTEIIDYYQSVEDLFGFEGDVLLQYLSAEQARPFCAKDADFSDWKQKPLECDQVIAEMRDYMEFAWGKVEGHRGISASCSVEKMCGWLWLLGDNETLAFAQDDKNYKQYGAPILKKICEVYGFPVPEGEDIANMTQGRPCWIGCEEGCSR